MVVSARPPFYEPWGVVLDPEFHLAEPAPRGASRPLREARPRRHGVMPVDSPFPVPFGPWGPKGKGKVRSGAEGRSHPSAMAAGASGPGIPAPKPLGTGFGPRGPVSWSRSLPRHRPSRRRALRAKVPGGRPPPGSRARRPAPQAQGPVRLPDRPRRPRVEAEGDAPPAGHPGPAVAAMPRPCRWGGLRALPRARGPARALRRRPP